MQALPLGAATIALALAMLVGTPVLARSFAAVDRNSDDVIEYQEARRGLKNMSDVHFEKCDTNGDGVVDRKEYTCLSSIYDSLYNRRD